MGDEMEKDWTADEDDETEEDELDAAGMSIKGPDGEDEDVPPEEESF